MKEGERQLDVRLVVPEVNVRLVPEVERAGTEVEVIKIR